jgi:hypothetical protein
MELHHFAVDSGLAWEAECGAGDFPDEFARTEYSLSTSTPIAAQRWSCCSARASFSFRERWMSAAGPSRRIADARRRRRRNPVAAIAAIAAGDRDAGASRRADVRSNLAAPRGPDGRRGMVRVRGVRGAADGPAGSLVCYLPNGCRVVVPKDAIGLVSQVKAAGGFGTLVVRRAIAGTLGLG